MIFFDFFADAFPSTRKHTGERPFACHCGKQFSRLDNLRQHAQTVHADKQDQNEHMMRELTALHTSMAAAHKSANSRGKRAQQAHAQAAAAAAQGQGSSTLANQSVPGGAAVGGSYKAEELQRGLSSSSNYGQQRPGNSLGYDVGPDQNGSSPAFAPNRTWQSAASTTPQSGPTALASQQQSGQQQQQHQQRVPSTSAAYSANYSAHGHSFREPGQSFRVPPAVPTTSSSAAQQQQQQQFGKQSYLQQQQQQLHQQQQPSPTATGGGGQSFLPSPAELALPGAPRPSSSSGRGSRPPTSSGAPTDLPPSASYIRTTLPPISSVVPQSLAAPGQSSSILPSLQSSGSLRRPTTVPRPGTAPAAYLTSRHSFGGGGAGLAPITELSVHQPGRGGVSHYSEQLGGAYAAYDTSRGGGREREYPPSPPDGSGSNDSPFSFHPPSLADPPALSRKRTLGSYSDSSDDDALGSSGAARPPPTPSTAGGAPTGTEYEYGSESRPQSRRLSVMELCNDPAAADASASRAFLPLSGASRPSTASGRFATAGAGPAAAFASDVGRMARRNEPLSVTTSAFSSARSPTLSTGRGSPSAFPHVGVQQHRSSPTSGTSKIGRESPHDQVRVSVSPRQSTTTPTGVRV